MLHPIVIFVFSVLVLVLGADLLVTGASRVARGMKIPSLIIGLTVVAFGTSLPETAASVSASLEGRTDIALGNIVGSNIYNLLLILGLAAVLAPLSVSTQLVRQEVPIMIGVTLLLIGFIFDGTLVSSEATVLFALVFVYTFYLIFQSRRAIRKHLVDDEKEPEIETGLLSKVPAAALILAGLLMLMFGGRWVVGSATEIALLLGVSELVIGLTVVAIGTSLPEVATCVTAVCRGERDMAVGNVVGSNIFNVLLCLGLSGMVAADGLPAPQALLNFDLWVMLAVACITLPIVLSGGVVSRWEGWILLGYCVAYIAYTLLNASEHDALPVFSYVMLAFIIPITVVIVLSAFVSQSH